VLGPLDGDLTVWAEPVRRPDRGRCRARHARRSAVFRRGRRP
jgi:hypothetical protein